TLSGFRPVEESEPVTHVSYFEADAFTNWSGARLPTEFEWERAATDLSIEGNFVESEHFHPQALSASARDRDLDQMFGDVWEWTRSAYSPYPGYRAGPGALGEYNGKFMCNQYVLRGVSCAGRPRCRANISTTSAAQRYSKKSATCRNITLLEPRPRFFGFTLTKWRSASARGAS